jgi:uncharacterized protein (TIGR03790 family)
MKVSFTAPICVLLIACAADVGAQSAENVAVVINTNSPASQRIGEHYVKERGIPAGNVIRIQTSVEDSVSRAMYAATIERQVSSALSRERAYDRVLYLVLTKGIPLRIVGTTGPDGTMAGVDSELALLYRRLTGQPVLTRGRVDNPYFLGAREVSTARPFSHRDFDIFLVSRHDAFTVEEAMALVDRGKAPVTEGRIVLDQRDALVNRGGEDWLELADKRLMAVGQGDRVLLEMTPKPARDVKPVLGYFSWGSTDPQNRVRSLGMGFVPGSIAGTFVSTDGRTFKEPPATWKPTNDANRSTWFEGSPQSLIGDLIREGVTGVAGQVAEPYLQSSVRPEILFPAYLAGFNLIESFYLAIPHLSWQTVVVGDPLCAPFPRRPLSRADLDSPIDPETDLPAFFSKRRIASLAATMPGTPSRAVLLMVRGESSAARGDLAKARQALEQAAEAAPNAAGPRLQLALLQEQAGLHDLAQEGYQRVLAIQPNNGVALNNLAYSLAVRKKAPTEALPVARRAAALAPNDPNVIDTLAWVEHLIGNDVEAARLIAAAVKAAPGSAELRLHAAVIYAARGAQAVSEGELKEALRLAPALEQSEEVKQLRARLQELERGAR